MLNGVSVDTLIRLVQNEGGRLISKQTIPGN